MAQLGIQAGRLRVAQLTPIVNYAILSYGKQNNGIRQDLQHDSLLPVHKPYHRLYYQGTRIDLNTNERI